jgi:hypothetical protein
MNEVKLNIKIKLGRIILPLAVKFLLSMIFKTYINKPDSFDNKIFVFWHSKMLLGWWLFKDQNPLALVSQSSDGEILTNLLRNWHYEIIRGSSSKGGKEALKELILKSINGKPIIITPDGPQGPANKFKNGPLIISMEKNYDIIPVKIIFNKKIVLVKSWDNFEIPLPFSNCKVIFGSPFKYQKYLNEKELINFKNNICKQM